MKTISILTILVFCLFGAAQTAPQYDFDAYRSETPVFRGILKDEFGPYQYEPSIAQLYNITGPVACGAYKDSQGNYLVSEPMGPTTYATNQAWIEMFVLAQPPQRFNKRTIYESGNDNNRQTITMEWLDENVALGILEYLDSSKPGTTTKFVFEFRGGTLVRYESRWYPKYIPKRYREFPSNRDASLHLESDTGLPFYINFICENEATS